MMTMKVMLEISYTDQAEVLSFNAKVIDTQVDTIEVARLDDPAPVFRPEHKVFQRMNDALVREFRS